MLNFDPHRWIAEHDSAPPSVVTVLNVARPRAENGKAISRDEAATPATTATLQACRSALDALDPGTPLHGIPPTRWKQLIGDARWVMDHFAEQAFRDS